MRLIVLLVVFMVFASVFGKVCTSADRKKKACTFEVREACVCYKGGRCVDKSTNMCVECQKSNVYSVTYGRCR